MKGHLERDIQITFFFRNYVLNKYEPCDAYFSYIKTESIFLKMEVNDLFEMVKDK
jgi:hypothetical protein